MTKLEMVCEILRSESGPVAVQTPQSIKIALASLMRDSSSLLCNIESSAICTKLGNNSGAKEIIGAATPEQIAWAIYIARASETREG